MKLNAFPFNLFNFSVWASQEVQGNPRIIPSETCLAMWAEQYKVQASDVVLCVYDGGGNIQCLELNSILLHC